MKNKKYIYIPYIYGWKLLSKREANNLKNTLEYSTSFNQSLAVMVCVNGRYFYFRILHEKPNGVELEQSVKFYCQALDGSFI